WRRHYKRMSNLIPSRRLWLGLGGTGLFLGLFIWRTDLGELGDALAQANYWWVVPAVAIWFVSAAFRSLRWHYLLRRLANLRTRTLSPIGIIVVVGEILGRNEELTVLAIGMSVAFALLLALFVYVASSPQRARRWTEWAIGLLPGSVRQWAQA